VHDDHDYGLSVAIGIAVCSKWMFGTAADGINWNEVLDTLPMDVRMTHMVASLGK
jgi:hypothetical protein